MWFTTQIFNSIINYAFYLFIGKVEVFIEKEWYKKMYGYTMNDEKKTAWNGCDDKLRQNIERSKFVRDTREYLKKNRVRKKD